MTKRFRRNEDGTPKSQGRQDRRAEAESRNARYQALTNEQKIASAVVQGASESGRQLTRLRKLTS